MERNIRLAVQVGDVEAGPLTWHEDSFDVGPYPLQERPVLAEREVLVVFFADILRR